MCHLCCGQAKRRPISTEVEISSRNRPVTFLFRDLADQTPSGNPCPLRKGKYESAFNIARLACDFFSIAQYGRFPPHFDKTPQKLCQHCETMKVYNEELRLSFRLSAIPCRHNPAAIQPGPGAFGADRTFSDFLKQG
jgi:hypothetical protein